MNAKVIKYDLRDLGQSIGRGRPQDLQVENLGQAG